MTEVRTEPFEFVGNNLSLDFVNTVNDRGRSNFQDQLVSYNDLVEWSRLTETITSQDAEQLLVQAWQRPEEAAHALQQAVDAREVIYRIFTAIALEETPNQSDLTRLNDLFAHAMSRACITYSDNTFSWDWVQKASTLESLLWPIVRSAAELLTSEDLQMARQCAAYDCTWLFLDTSKNHSRRWCDMKSCGNRTKVGRHYERKKQKDQ